MEDLITVKIPHEWIKGLPEEDLTLKHIFKMGIYEFKIKRAIQLYQDGIGSLGYIAENFEIPKQDLICEFRQRNIEPNSSEITLQEEFSE